MAPSHGSKRMRVWRLLAAGLFVFLVLCNIQINASDQRQEGIDLFGLRITAGPMSAMAAPEWPYKLSVYETWNCHSPCCYMARCGLPGNECTDVMNPTCFNY